jgi:DNA-directed RNA polymerase alpha subunit
VRGGLSSIEALRAASDTEILALPNLGEATLREVRAFLATNPSLTDAPRGAGEGRQTTRPSAG